MGPTIYKPSIYKGAGIYKTGAEGGGGGIGEELFRITDIVAGFQANQGNNKTIIDKIRYDGSIPFIRNSDFGSTTSWQNLLNLGAAWTSNEFLDKLKENNAVTYEMYIRRHDTNQTANPGGLVKIQSGVNGGFLLIPVPSNNIDLWIDGSLNYGNSHLVTPDFSNWSHFAIVLIERTALIYYNGIFAKAFLFNGLDVFSKVSGITLHAMYDNCQMDYSKIICSNYAKYLNNFTPESII